MLVLSRKTGERIKIGDDVEIVVCQIRGGRAQIGVVAPKGLKVLRGELPPRPAPEKNVTPAAQIATTTKPSAAVANLDMCEDVSAPQATNY